MFQNESLPKVKSISMVSLYLHNEGLKSNLTEHLQVSKIHQIKLLEGLSYHFSAKHCLIPYTKLCDIYIYRSSILKHIFIHVSSYSLDVSQSGVKGRMAVETSYFETMWHNVSRSSIVEYKYFNLFLEQQQVKFL